METPAFRALTEEGTHRHWLRARNALNHLYDEMEAQGTAPEVLREVDEAIGCILRCLPLYMASRRPRPTAELKAAAAEARAAAEEHRASRPPGGPLGLNLDVEKPESSKRTFESEQPPNKSKQVQIFGAQPTSTLEEAAS